MCVLFYLFLVSWVWGLFCQGRYSAEFPEWEVCSSSNTPLAPTSGGPPLRLLLLQSPLPATRPLGRLGESTGKTAQAKLPLVYALVKEDFFTLLRWCEGLRDSSPRQEREGKEEKRKRKRERGREGRGGQERRGQKLREGIKLDKIIKSNHSRELDILTRSYQSFLILSSI